MMIFDIEGDGLKPTKIWCMSCMVEGKVRSTTSYDKMREVLLREEVIVGHNITRWDVPVLERILGIKIKAKIIDTLALSWYLYPKRVQHGLEFWGVEFGIPKPPIVDWNSLSIEEYIHRCEEDVKINTRLFDQMWRYLLRIYGTEEKVWKLLDYLAFKMDCAREQERSGWKLDVEFCQSSLRKLSELHTEATEALREVMPSVPIYVDRGRPKIHYKRDGSLSVAGAKWQSLLKSHNLPENFSEVIKEQVREDPPNPASHIQIKDWLYSLGWVPNDFKHKREADGLYTKIPQVRVDGKEGKELSSSVKGLVPKEPGVAHLEEVTVLAHRISILKGFLEAVDERGYVRAEIGGLANTLRFKHRVCVNLPSVGKPYGDLVRGCLIAPSGYEQLGSDMSSLEDRTKQHYMWEYDPEYVKEMNVEGFDPHIDIGVLSGMMSQEDADDFKSGNEKPYKAIRHDAKQVNYSCTYGVTPEGIVRNTGMSLVKARKLHATYWKRNWSIQSIADACEVKTVSNQKWLYNPVAQLWYSLRHEKDRFSTLNQGTGTYCFDMWVKEIRKVRPQLTGQFHDEIILCVKQGNRERGIKLLKDSIKKVNESLRLNRELDVDIQFGENYAQIH